MADNREGLVYELMGELRVLTRSTLLHQHVIAQLIGLHVTDAECIDFLQEMGTCTAGDLAKATRLTTGAITNVIDRLEKAGFVQRSAHPTDRRKVLVSFIGHQHTPARLHYQSLAARIQELLSTYSADELSLLIKYTHAVGAIYRQELGQIDQ